MLDNRPSPPSAVKRQLRQEAGFGCCFCGHPFLQYHHIVPWAEDAHFRPEDMMVVCGQCHHLLTVGAIPDEAQRNAKAKPKNIVDGNLSGQLYVTSKELRVDLAGGYALETPQLLIIGHNTILQARVSPDTGTVLISAIIQDQSGNNIAQLLDNEWSMLPGAVWDFECYPRHAAIRNAPGDVAFVVNAREDRISMHGKWYFGGSPIEFTPKLGKWKGHNFTAMNVEHCQIYVGFR